MRTSTGARCPARPELLASAGTMLLHVPDVLDRAQVAAIRHELDAIDWIDGRATVGSQGAALKRNRQVGEHSPAGRELGARIEAAVRANPLFFSAALPAQMVPPLFNCYGIGEHYQPHVDGAVRGVPGQCRQLRTDVSCTLFLSDPEEYDGGELVLSDSFASHEVKLPAGDMILYTAGTLHGVRPVTRGERISSFFWVESLVADVRCRQILFDLDRTIQQVRQALGDDERSIALTGTYHNLLRMWAAT